MDNKQQQSGQVAALGAETASSITLAEAVISEQELENLADFTVRFPTYLPATLPAQKITGLKKSGEEAVGSADFILHYGSGKDHWLMIEQATSITGVDLKNYSLVNQVNIDGEAVSIYKQIEHVTGNFTHYYFHLGDVTCFVRAVGLPEEELWKIVTSLQSRS